jgi:hypothetical protein
MMPNGFSSGGFVNRPKEKKLSDDVAPYNRDQQTRTQQDQSHGFWDRLGDFEAVSVGVYLRSTFWNYEVW